MRLYALLDEDSLCRFGWRVERFVRRASSLGAEIIQYRNKSGDRELTKKRLEELVSMFSGRVIVNDYPELAYMCGGVHVGQEDLLGYGENTKEGVENLRKIVGDGVWIGLSTHNEEEILEANGLEIDYIGLGACRSTGTKSDATVLGPERISLLASLSSHPVAAIGGVRLDDNIENVAYHVIGSGLYED